MAGIIDADYVGEIRVLLHVTSEAITLNAQELTAQLVIVPYLKGQWRQLEAPSPVTTKNRRIRLH